MKDFAIAIALLLVLVAAFSTIESRIEFEYPFGNWAVPSDSGQPVAGEGKAGGGNVFSFGSAQETQTAKPAQAADGEHSAISVEIVTEQKQKQRQMQPWESVLLCYACVHCAACYVFIVIFYSQWFKEREYRKLWQRKSILTQDIPKKTLARLALKQNAD